MKKLQGYGNKLSQGELWFPRAVESYKESSESAICDTVEREAEEAVLAGKIVVINGANLAGSQNSLTRKITERAGVVPLRWGARRLILATPEQGRLLRDKQELVRAWRLWRYEFDEQADGYTIGLPKRAESALLKLVSSGADWRDAIERGPDIRISDEESAIFVEAISKAAIQFIKQKWPDTEEVQLDRKPLFVLNIPKEEFAAKAEEADLTIGDR